LNVAVVLPGATCGSTNRMAMNAIQITAIQPTM